jgi:hypothetical protein
MAGGRFRTYIYSTAPAPALWLSRPRLPHLPPSWPPQWIAKQQLARQGTKCFWREPVGQQKSAQRHRGTNVPQNRVPAGTEDDRLSLLQSPAAQPAQQSTSGVAFAEKPPAAIRHHHPQLREYEVRLPAWTANCELLLLDATPSKDMMSAWQRAERLAVCC